LNWGGFRRRIAGRSSTELQIGRSDGRPKALGHDLQHGWQERALPFDAARLLGGMKIAVIVHLFYADLWDEIAGWLKNIPIDFDIFVSVPRENAGELRAIVLRDHPQAEVIEVPNAGRDVGAFFAVLPRVLAGNYSVLCKLHSKKGEIHPDAWRDLLLRGLLASKVLVTKILHAFAREPKLALAGPREAYLFGPDQITQNRQKVEELTRSLYPGRSIPAQWGFFAGTMFWARPDFFRPIVQREDKVSSFESDNTASDGQLAHAWERVFGIHATLAGKRIGLTEIAGPPPLERTIEITPAPGQPSIGSFVRVLKMHALRLRGDLPFGAQLPLPVCRQLPTSQGARRYLQLIWWTVSLQIIPRLVGFCIHLLQARRVRASSLFDRNWYLEGNPDVRAAGVDPALHYVRHGAAGLRDPGPRFDTAWYLAYYPDVAASGINPLVHYLRYGAKEGRYTRPSDIVPGELTERSPARAANPAGEIALDTSNARAV
jgi:hypothetical protein